jgi:hypothetical protein
MLRGILEPQVGRFEHWRSKEYNASQRSQQGETWPCSLSDALFVHVWRRPYAHACGLRGWPMPVIAAAAPASCGLGGAMVAGAGSSLKLAGKAAAI